MADAMIDLKRRKADPSDAEYFAPPDQQPDYYPVVMYLGSAEVTALGLSDEEVGAEFDMLCHCRVTGKQSRQSDGGDDFDSMDLTVVSAAKPENVVAGAKPRKKGDIEGAVYGKPTVAPTK